MLEKAHMLGSNMTVRWTIKDKVLLDLCTSKQLAAQATPTHVGILCPICVAERQHVIKKTVCLMKRANIIRTKRH